MASNDSHKSNEVFSEMRHQHYYRDAVPHVYTVAIMAQELTQSCSVSNLTRLHDHSAGEKPLTFLQVFYAVSRF